MVYNHRPDFSEEQTAAIKKICDSLRDFRKCGYEWPEICMRIQHWITLMEGEEADTAKQKTIADAVEKSYRKGKKRKKVKKVEAPSDLTWLKKL